MKLGLHRHAPLGGTLLGATIMEASELLPSEKLKTAGSILGFVVMLGGHLVKSVLDQDRYADSTREQLAQLRGRLEALEGKKP